MKISKLALVLGSASAFVFAVACSSSSGDDSTTVTDAGPGTDSTTPPTDSGPPVDSAPPACTPLADGTYTVHYTGADGGAGCPPADQQVTIPAVPVDAGAGVDSGPNPCTTTTNSTTCAVTNVCNETISGFHDALNITTTPSADGTSATGTYSNVLTEPDGGPFRSCTGITFTYTKN